MSFFKKLFGGTAKEEASSSEAAPIAPSYQRSLAIGIKYSTWMYSGAPCAVNAKRMSAEDVRMNALHKAANGKRFANTTGLKLDGKFTFPGQEKGCRCTSKAVIPGFN